MLINYFFFVGGGRKRPSGSTRAAHDVTCKTGRLSWPNMTERPVLNPADKVQNIHFSQSSLALSPKKLELKNRKRRIGQREVEVVRAGTSGVVGPGTAPSPSHVSAAEAGVGERDRMNTCFVVSSAVRMS